MKKFLISDIARRPNVIAKAVQDGPVLLNGRGKKRLIALSPEQFNALTGKTKEPGELKSADNGN